MFARGISSFTRTWMMNLGCQKRLSKRALRPCVRTETRHMTSRLGIKFPTPYAWGSNSPPPGKLKRSNARGMPGGMLKLRFDRYIRLVIYVMKWGLFQFAHGLCKSTKKFIFLICSSILIQVAIKVHGPTPPK